MYTNEHPAIYPSKSNDSVSVMVSPDSWSTLVNLVDHISSQIAQRLQKHPHLPLGYHSNTVVYHCVYHFHVLFWWDTHMFGDIHTLLNSSLITKWFIHSFSRNWITFNLSWRHVLNIVLCWNVLTLRLPGFGLKCSSFISFHLYCIIMHHWYHSLRYIPMLSIESIAWPRSTQPTLVDERHPAAPGNLARDPLRQMKSPQKRHHCGPLGSQQFAPWVLKKSQELVAEGTKMEQHAATCCTGTLSFRFLVVQTMVWSLGPTFL